MDLKQHIIDQVGNYIKDSFNIDKPFILVTKFKESGEWYDTDVIIPQKEQIDIINQHRGFEVLTDIKIIYLGSKFKIVLEGYNFDGFFHHLI